MQIHPGFEASNDYRAMVGKLFGPAPRSADQVPPLIATWMDTPLGAMLAVAGDAGVYLLGFSEEGALENAVVRLRKRFHAVIVAGEHSHLATLRRELDEYFAGQRQHFSVPMVIAGTPFQERAWQFLRTIPYGMTRSYADMARAIGATKAVRAVGQANGRNTLPILLPCHRVIGANGALTGYGGGMARKQWLLTHEQKVLAKSRQPAEP